MRSPFCRYCDDRRLSDIGDDRGAVLIIALFILFALLAASGLAIDAGNLYRARLRMQKAADVAALSGIGITIHRSELLRGFDESQVRQFVVDRARQIVIENLSNNAIAVDPVRDITADYYEVDQTQDGEKLYRLNVQVTADIPHLFIHLVPFDVFGMGNAVSSTRMGATAVQATSERSAGTVSLILDVSNSMACPSQGACDCLSPRRRGSCEEEAAELGVRTKVDLLKESVMTFVDQFDSNIDRISIVPFNIAASLDDDYGAGGQAVLYRPRNQRNVPASYGFDRANFEQALANFSPASNTNICDGLLRAYEEAARVQLTRPDAPALNSEVSYVVFSDGAPTAGRLLLAENQNLPINRNANAPMADFDYQSYTVQWLDPGSGGAAPRSWAVPSPLVMSGRLPINRSDMVPPLGSVPDCSSPGGALQSQAETLSSLFSGCIGSLAAHRPYAPDEVYGREYGTTRDYSHWREQYYNCAIETADFLREQRGTLFVIGLGAPGGIAADPYQNIGDTVLRKDVFLSRLAEDSVFAHQLPVAAGGASFPEFTYSGYQTYQQRHQSGQNQEGVYQPTADPEELVDVFKKMAIRILLRLVR
ncbi:MAG: VWA domain-containing protein [Bdellovibrionales bacterium]|nr:VWA domain-containing protein [Bdellovibrionales bacterium]